MGHSNIDYLNAKMFEKIICNEDIENVFQSIISLKDGDILGYEALCRGLKETIFENPKELFDMARAQGRIIELERICKRDAIKKFKKKDSSLKLFVNIDPCCFFDDKEGKSLIENFFKNQEKDFSYVVFEVTEQTCINDYRRFHDVLHKYKDVGKGIALDDVGKGYSGLNLLVNVEPLYMKIDMDLVRDIHKKPFKQAMLKSLVEFCNNTNTKVIAEGIENSEELDVLVDLGIHYGQGYYIQRPSSEILNIHPNIKSYILNRNLIKQGIKVQNITTVKIGKISKNMPYIGLDTVGAGQCII